MWPRYPGQAASGMTQDVDHPQPGQRGLHLGQLLAKRDGVFRSIGEEQHDLSGLGGRRGRERRDSGPSRKGSGGLRWDAPALPGGAAIRQPPQDAAHARDADTAGDEDHPLEPLPQGEGAVRSLDLDFGAQGKGVEGILERGAPQSGGEFQERLRGRARVREMMFVRLGGTGKSDLEPLPGPVFVTREAARTGR